MAENDNMQQAEFTQEGKLVVSLSTSLIAGDINSTFRTIKEHMLANELKVSKEIILEFEIANLITGKS